MDTTRKFGIGDIRAILAEELRGSPDARYLHRLHCVMLVLLGHPLREVASWFHADRTTVARWVHGFLKFGIDGLKRDRDRTTGRPAGTGPEQLRVLLEAVRRPPAKSGFVGEEEWHGRLVSDFLKRRFQISLSVRQCQRLLHRVREKPETEASGRGA